MSDEVKIGETNYISSKRAAQISGYAQDYIGQLCRAGHIDAQRLGGLWYVNLDSLYKHKQKADSYVPVAPRREQKQETASSVSFDGAEYVSAARAAELTGYHQDYVGQLARAGTIRSRQVSNRWYVEQKGLVAHKAKKDRMLAAVQAQAVGIKKQEAPKPVIEEHREPFYRYTSERGAPLPTLGREDHEITIDRPEIASAETDASEWNAVPIRISKVKHVAAKLDHETPVKHVKSRGVRISGKTMFYATSSAVAATIVIMLSFSLVSIKDSSVYTLRSNPLQNMTASASSGAQGLIDRLGDALENVLSQELVFKRSELELDFQR